LRFNNYLLFVHQNSYPMIRILERILLVFILSCTIILHNQSIQAANDTKWVVVTNEDGIEVMERWVTIENNVKVRERSGRMNLNCSMEEALALISDETKIHLWMSNVESVSMLKKVSPSEWYVQTNLNAPWPFGKQDMVSKYTVVKDETNNTVKVFITPENKLVPKQNNVERLDTFNAQWDLSITERGKVKIVFTTKSTIPPEYPTWMQDPVVRKVFFANLRNFKSILLES